MTENSIILARQLGNLYLLCFFIAVALFATTSEIKVVRAYLFALWLGDIGHVGISWYGLGEDLRMNTAAWNATTWGNVAFTVSSLLLLLCTKYTLPCLALLCRYTNRTCT